MVRVHDGEGDDGLDPHSTQYLVLSIVLEGPVRQFDTDPPTTKHNTLLRDGKCAATDGGGSTVVAVVRWGKCCSGGGGGSNAICYCTMSHCEQDKRCRTI